MQDCGKEALQWALFAQQYHLDLLEAEAVHHIVKNFVEVESLEGYDELSQRLLRHISQGLAQEMTPHLDRAGARSQIPVKKLFVRCNTPRIQ